MRSAEEKAFRIYLTDAIYAINHSISHGLGGSVMGKRFYEVLNPKPEDTRTGEEIALDVLNRAGIEVV